MLSEAEGASIEILLEAHDLEGNKIGEPKHNLDNNVTKVINLMSGDIRKISINMKEGVEGKFLVKALNPNTMLAYDQIQLETDYLI